MVVGYASGSIPEVGGEAALLVPEGDVQALAAAAALALGDPNEFHARRHSGLVLAQERTWAKVAAKQVKLYRAAVEGIRSPLLSGSPQVLRDLAREEFGPPAQALGQARPFALPYLRQSNAASRALGRAMDAWAEVRARIERAG